MSQSRTLAELRTETRQRADIENATTWIDNDEVDRYINEAIRELWDLMLEAHGHELYLQETTITTVSGTDTYEINRTDGQGTVYDFYILKGVDLERDGKRWPLHPYTFLQREDADNNDLSDGWPRTYRLLGSVSYTSGAYTAQIRLQPTPGDAYTIHIIYVPSAPYLDSDSETWWGFNGWEEYVTVDAAIRCLEKEESDTEALQLRKAKLEQRIRNMAGQRDWQFPERVQDNQSRYWGGPWWLEYEPPVGGGR